MQLSDNPQEDAETLFVEDDSESNRRTLEDLTSRTEQLKEELLNVTDHQLFEDPELLEDTLAAARAALEQCRSARSELGSVREQQNLLSSTWKEIQRRRKILTELREAILEVSHLNDVAQNVVDAKDRGDHDTMSKACVVFERLNSKGADRLDDTYKCLHSVSERVSLAVAESMKMLRTSLRTACRRFDLSEYRKCLKSFSDLGAISNFCSHVLQIFGEEATNIYNDAVQQEGKASQIVMVFSADLHDLLSQFASVIAFHVSAPEDIEESERDEELRESVASSFRSKQLPFRRFAELTAKLIDEHRFLLITEQTTTLLQVFESCNYLCDTAIATGNALFEHHEYGAPFRSKQKLATRRDASRDREGIKLRRSRSLAGLEEIVLSSDSSRSERRAWRSEIRSPISKALKAVAKGCLTVTHARHAEELLVITKAPECWVRVQMSEDSIRQMLEDVLSGTEGRIRQALQTRTGTTSKMSCTDLGAGLLETNPSAWTLTTASISVLRWMSEYVTIGITEPEGVSESLSNCTDLFLMFLHTSIDMKSRVRIPEADSWFKSIEDVFLERPRTRTISDFMSHDTFRMFQTFVNRYSSSQGTHSENDIETERWGYENNLTLPHYIDAVGVTFSNAFTSNEAIIRQCVAAEGIGTLCAVMQTFFDYIESLITEEPRFSEAYEVQRMASLRASVLLGKAVQKAFYELLAWDIVGGWDAVSAVAETYRSFHSAFHTQHGMTATSQSAYINTMIERMKRCYLETSIPPQAAEVLGMMMCSTAMTILLDGFACVRRIGFASASSQALVDIRTLEISLVELTGIHPCPGRLRTEMYVKATFLKGRDLDTWIDHHRRRLNLLDRHVRALQHAEDFEVPIVDQIITP